jgi:hypothetical protein
MRIERISGVLLVAAGVGLSAVLAAESKSAEATPHRVQPQAEAKSDQPGPEHKILGGFVGHWKSTFHVLETDAQTPVQDTQGAARSVSHCRGE